MIPATLPPRATLDAHDPSTTPTVPASRPCQARAMIDALHRRDAREREASTAHAEALRASTALRHAEGNAAHQRAMVTYEAERAAWLSRLCRHCGAPAVGRTGECQGCAIASVSDAMEAPT